MLKRTVAKNGVVYYESPLLAAAGVRHAFSTRMGGISPSPFDSLNLGNPSGCEFQDNYDRIWENYALLLHAIDCPTEPPLRVHQVHGSRVVEVEPGQMFDVSTRADAITSDDPSRPISVRIADCVPVLLASGDGKKVAAIHAGWRGVVSGVVTEAVRELVYRATKPARLIAAIGPCIGMDAFEVGPEVIAEFYRVFGPSPFIRGDNNSKGHVDLRRAIHAQLISAGLHSDCIDETDRCTSLHREEFFSHRRDRGVTGRLAAVICPTAA